MIWLTFLGAGLVLRYGGHIGIDTLQRALPARGARRCARSSSSLMLGFFAFMVVDRRALRDAARGGRRRRCMEIPIGAVYLAMPIGFALLIVHLLLMRGP